MINISITEEADYRNVLGEGINEIHESRFYYHFSLPSIEQGWILHISVVPIQMRQLCTLVLPILLRYEVPFKLVKNQGIHYNMNNAFFGIDKVGKNISIFPDSVSLLRNLVEDINAISNAFRGPNVVTDFRVGKVSFIRYGSFKNRIEPDSTGGRNRVIFNESGERIIDYYYQPPQCPPWEQLPLKTFQDGEAGASKLFIIGGKYLPYKILKSDIKGNVYQCVFLSRFAIPKFCVLKEGRANMHADFWGRDMYTLLRWQFDVCLKIEGKVPVPKMFDFLRMADRDFIVMEYVSGRSIAVEAYRKLKLINWVYIEREVKHEIVGYLIDILNSIGVLHELGYVHRDITGWNFLIDDFGHAVFIDLELIYDVNNNSPNPPHGKGTSGFLSPQQARGEVPCVQDDFYSIGALLIQVLGGGFEPVLVIEDDRVNLYEKLLFLIGSRLLVSKIMKSLSNEPNERISVLEVKRALESYRSELGELNKSQPVVREIADASISQLIDMSLTAIGGSAMTVDSLWFSAIKNEFDWDVYPMGDKHIYPAMHRGVSGVVYVLLLAKSLGCDIGKSSENIRAAWKFIGETVVARVGECATGLHYGTSGIALCMMTALKYGEEVIGGDVESTIYAFVERENEGLDIVSGMSGDGLVLIQLWQYAKEEKFRILLEKIVDRVLRRQNRDGSWSQEAGKKDVVKVNGFGHGISGIVYFLLEYGIRLERPDAVESAVRGLKYIMGVGEKRKGFYDWTNSDRTRDRGTWWCHGAPGIALCFFKAFEYLKDDCFLKMAEMALRKHTTYLNYPNFSQCHGLTGLGEIYLEAYRVTQSREWIERASWILDTLNAFKFVPHEGNCYWMVEKASFPTADLMIGNAGILHFLLRYRYPDRLSFPMLPAPLCV